MSIIRRRNSIGTLCRAFTLTLLAGGAAQAAQSNAPGISLVVLDKKCTRIVEPYKISDNIGRIVTDGASSLLNGLQSRLNGGRGSSPDQISDAARLQAKRSNWLPMKTEVLYGERAHAQETNLLSRDSRLGQKYYPIADAMLADITNQLGEEHEYTFQLFILKNSTRNAVARPGGFLYLDQGLLDDPRQHPKAYFALAHELGHVLQRHETRELQGLIVDSYQSQKDLQKAIAGVRVDPASALGTVKINKDSYTRHHIDQELQADSCAARMLSRVFPDRAGFAESVDAFLQDLPPPGPESAAKAPPSSGNGSKSASKAEELLATAHDVVTSPADRHPSTAERAANLRSIYAELTSSAAAR